jgi:hypothetical protein
MAPWYQALAQRFFGPVDFGDLPLGARDVVAAVCGGRGGKSYVLVALRLVWGMLVRDLSPLAPGQQAYATVVAPNEKLRQEVVNYGLGVCRSKPELRRLMRLPKGTREDDTPSEFGVYRPDFDRIVMRALPSGRVSIIGVLHRVAPAAWPLTRFSSQ